jgi:hypothetical protein
MWRRVASIVVSVLGALSLYLVASVMPAAAIPSPHATYVYDSVTNGAHMDADAEASAATNVAAARIVRSPVRSTAVIRSRSIASGVGAEAEGGVVQAFRPLEGEAPTGPNISLEQARAAAERNGLDLSNIDLKYESPDAPSYRASGYGYSSFTFSGEPYVNAAGNYEITLQNAGLASEQDAVATIAHEWAHLYVVGPEDHAAAEEFAQQLMEGYVP